MWWLLIFGSYYVIALAVFMFLMLGSSAMYKSEGSKVPWRYLGLVMIPFVGFWIGLLVLVSDWRVHLENEESRHRNRKEGK